jgi:hypothetical protein
MLKKTLFCMILALVLAPAFAANRPPFFIDDFQNLALFDFDSDGNEATLALPPSEDNFIRFNPDGSIFGHLQDVEADFEVRPSTGGILNGSGRVQANVALDQGFNITCPATISWVGTVSDGVSSFSVRRIYVANRNPAGGCTVIHNDITISSE